MNMETILTVGDPWINEDEEHVLRSSFSGTVFQTVHCDLDLSQPLTDVPRDIARTVTGIFINRHWLTENDISHFPRLKGVVRMGVGWDRIDRTALAKRNVTFCNTPDYGVTEVADHTLALALSLQRGILLHYVSQRQSAPAWDPVDPTLLPSFRSLSRRPKSRIWGAIGFGRIGSAAALRAKAFGWKVIFCDPYLPTGYEKVFEAERTRRPEEVFSRANIISLHCRLTPETRHMVNDQTLQLVQPGTILINTARGGLVDLDAVERALEDGRLSGAGLDVLETEPPMEPLPNLLKAYRAKAACLDGKLVITPHIAYYSEESLEDRKRNCLETMRDVLLDGLSTNVVQGTEQ
ncbi:hypothetical protein BD324DRAFT_624382 [Kockovaella imperatae]|uniref:C-terminal binding protein n=1 Tax=Kockovaella imperatae TaxID=4999 RepID=A0A1Y1UJ23_9TREE|nr:hypothetical protein BD324DRAFT_624382 [Kockovaella imperatae]ORX38068.1 hypothetical protein BD324DRAFT_624382 [Kockovaella imperatae]